MVDRSPVHEEIHHEVDGHVARMREEAPGQAQVPREVVEECAAVAKSLHVLVAKEFHQDALEDRCLAHYRGR